MIIKCYKCASDLELPPQIGFKEACQKCNADVHCCKNCKFFDLNSYNSCRESQAERIVDKEKANFCDYFSAGAANASSADKNSKINDAKKNLEDLFK